MGRSRNFEHLDASVRECLYVPSFLGNSFEFNLLFYVLQDSVTLTGNK
jgi:hypothetical protein